PPNRIGRRLGDLYAWMFGTERVSEPDASAEAADETLPAWRRNRGRREKDASTSPSQDLTELLFTTDDAQGGFDQAVAPVPTDAITEVVDPSIIRAARTQA
ncbi:MAG TPA: cell division protein FtsK, partial [Microbacterium ginsengisoli]|nr:cell division protein FtsK [Microbacterium ginsengisoli]